eukprot:2064878-Prymnesium_polylepis.1
MSRLDLRWTRPPRRATPPTRGGTPPTAPSPSRVSLQPRDRSRTSRAPALALRRRSQPPLAAATAGWPCAPP